MTAFAKFYLRKNIADEKVHSILRHVKENGANSASFERHSGEAVLHVHDRRDVQLVESSYPDLIDAKADLT